MDLEAKDKREKELDKEFEVAAKLQLEDWYLKYHEKISAIKAENRERQAITKEEDSADSFEWDKVVNLCGFKSPKSIKDTARMRSILLKLKESQM